MGIGEVHADGRDVDENLVGGGYRVWSVDDLHDLWSAECLQLDRPHGYPPLWTAKPSHAGAAEH